MPEVFKARNGVVVRGWSVDELEQLFAAARCMPGTIGGVPASHWWLALLVTVLDTQVDVCALMDARRSDFRDDTLQIGRVRYILDSITVEALQRLTDPPGDDPLLFRRDFDRNPHRTKLSALKRRANKLVGMTDLRFLSKNKLLTTDVFRKLKSSGRYLPESLRQVTADQLVPETLPVIQSQNCEVIPCNADVSVMAFFDKVYRPLKGIKASSADKIRKTLRTVAVMLGRELEFGDLSDELSDQYVLWLKSLEPCPRPATINCELRNLFAVWRFAWRRRKVQELPREMPRQKEPKRIPEAWSVAQMQQILESARKEPNGVEWVALLQTLYCTGLRINAALTLPRRSFDPASGWLTVPAEIQKQQADQVYRLSPDAAAALRKMLARTDGDRLFSWTFSYGWLTKKYRKILLRAELPAGKADMWHKLRRTSATHVCNAADEETARRHLGHSSLAMTRRYVDPRLLDRTHSAEMLPAIGGPRE